MQLRRNRGWLAGVLALLALAALLLAARPARADSDFQVSLGMNGAYVRRTPDLDVARVKDGPRQIQGSTAPMRGALWLLGGTLDTQLTLSDRWTVPIVGCSVMLAGGRFAPVSTSLDGSIAEVRPSSAIRADLLLPGLGRRWKVRRYMFGAAMRFGYSSLSMSGDVFGGTTRTSIGAASGTFLLQAEVEGCRRLDPERRICFQVAPRIYDQSALSGVQLGVRMEWGR